MQKSWFKQFGTLMSGQSTNGDNVSITSDSPGSVDSKGKIENEAKQRTLSQSEHKKKDSSGNGHSLFKTVERIYSDERLSDSGPHYSCVKVAQLMRSEHLRNMSTETKRSAILLALEANGTPVQRVVEDGVQRERVLEDTLRSCEKHVDEFEKQKQRENIHLQEQLKKLVEEHSARIQANNDEISNKKASFLSWRMELQEEQQRIKQALRQLTGDEMPMAAAKSAGAE